MTHDEIKAAVEAAGFGYRQGEMPAWHEIHSDGSCIAYFCSWSETIHSRGTVEDAIELVKWRISKSESAKVNRSEQPTLRDLFATAALQGVLVSDPLLQNHHGCCQTYAKMAYELADAMLAARKEQR